MPFAGNETKLRSKQECLQDYEELKTSATYSSRLSAAPFELLRSPSARSYVQLLLSEAPDAKEDVQGKLAVVTGVTMDGAAFHIAQELALQAGMHVIIMGRSESILNKCIAAITNEAEKRGVVAPSSKRKRQGQEQQQQPLVLYRHKYHLASLDSIKKAADFCTQLAHAVYDSRLQVLINFASVGSEAAKLTSNGLVEYNTGCNFIGTHFMTRLLLPLLKAAATPTYKPRVVQTTSIGHALGNRFDPHRLVEHPLEGGSPAGFIVVVVHSENNISDTGNTAVDDIKAEPSAGKSIPKPCTIREYEPQPGDKEYGQSKLHAVGKVGTQVGRSKMAVLAEAIHMASLYPELCFVSQYPGSVATTQTWRLPSQNLTFRSGLSGLFRLSPSQGARSALRAALDPDFNTAADLQHGVYLHANGNPWVPMSPATKDPVTNRPYTMEQFAKACYEAAETLLDKLVVTNEKCAACR